jgi:hypothetical protein
LLLLATHWEDDVMSTMVLDDKNALMPISEMLRSATDSVIEIRSASGGLLAKVLLTREPTDADYGPILEAADAEIEELRRRRRRDRAGDLTTSQLLQRLHGATPE